MTAQPCGTPWREWCAAAGRGRHRCQRASHAAPAPATRSVRALQHAWAGCQRSAAGDWRQGPCSVGAWAMKKQSLAPDPLAPPPLTGAQLLSELVTRRAQLSKALLVGLGRWHQNPFRYAACACTRLVGVTPAGSGTGLHASRRVRLQVCPCQCEHEQLPHQTVVVLVQQQALDAQAPPFNCGRRGRRHWQFSARRAAWAAPSAAHGCGCLPLRACTGRRRLGLVTAQSRRQSHLPPAPPWRCSAR